jgi:archaellum biogenesis ATPase FlaH
MVNILAIVTDTFNDDYINKIMPIIKLSSGKNNKILYISLNKTYKSMAMQLQQNNIDISNFFFIDTITSSLIKPAPVDNCIFLKTANNTKKFYQTMIKIIKERKINIMVFDSLSSLTSYKNMDEIINFISLLVGSLSALNCSSVFICLKIDKNYRLIQHIKMNVEKVIELD